MKSRTVSYRVLTLLLILLSGVIALSQTGSRLSKDIRLLTLEVKPDKSSYLPGELITLDFRILNASKEPVLLPKGLDVWSGHLQVFISDESNVYKMYKGPRWGLADVIGGASAKLAPGDSYRSTATVLHNHRIETTHLNEKYAAQISKGLIPTEYVLPEPGIYFIKATLLDDGSECKIESEPVRVVIEEPYGIDLEVWNKIKGNGNYARFIQTGDLVEAHDGPKTAGVKATLEEIEKTSALSRYSTQIRAALSRYRTKFGEKK